MNKGEEILNEINNNTEMGLLQGQKMIDSVDNLEPIMEGVLLKLDEISQKTGEVKLQNLTVPVDMSETNQLLTELMDEVKKKDDETYDLQIDDVTREKLKGDKGDSYILNQDDKKEIASLIDVPIVEKIIEKQPIVTNEIKEVAKKDTAKELKKKLESLKVGLDYEKLSNLPDIAKIAQIASQKATKTYALSEMEDVTIGSQTNGQALIWSATAGKWIPGAVSGGITTIGTIDSQTPSANGAVISGTELVMQSASTTVPGLVSVGNQSWTGTKSILKTITSATSNDSASNSITTINLSTADTAVSIFGTIDRLEIADSQDHLLGNYAASVSSAENSGAGTVALIAGAVGSLNNTGGGTITNGIGHAAFVANNSGTLTNAYGFKTLFLSGTNTYGFYNDIAGSVNVFTRTHILAGDAIRFYDTDNSHYTGIAANGTTTASIDYTLPAAGPAGDGYALVSTTTGVMSWVANPGAWSLTGNSGTTAGTNFLGTTDDVDLVFKRNSVEQARFVADQLTLKPSAGTYNITTSTDADTITVGVIGSIKQSQFYTSKDLISMKFIATTPTIVAGVEASVNGLVLYNGVAGLWLWPQVDSTGTQALVSDGSGALGWSSLSTGTVTSVDASGGTTGLSFTGGPITTSGTLTLGGTLALANGGTGTTTGLHINNLIAATGTNTINNANYAQEWQWNSLTTQTALKLSSSSITTGKLVNITSASTGILTNTGLLDVSYTGTPSNAGQTTVAINGSNSAVGNTSQVRIGVRGSASGGTLYAGGGTGYGGYFTATVVGNYNYGVYAAATGNNNNISAGGYFVGSGSNTTNAGVYATSTGAGGYGVYATTSNNVATNVGVYGQATTTLNFSSSTGGKFIASSAGSSSSYGVWGQAVTTSGGTAYGGYFTTTGASATNIAGYFTASGGTNNYGIIVANGRTGFGITTPTAFVHEVQPVSTTGSPTALLVAGGAHTTLTASTEATDINLNLARTVQFATGALTLQRAFYISAPTYGFVGASTLTTSATVSISGAPVKGTNAAITNTIALNIEPGAVSTATNSYGLAVNAQTGATNNYTAIFLGGNVGIGLLSPATILDISKSQNAASTVKITNGTSGTAAQADFRAYNSSGDFFSLGIYSAGTSTYGALTARSGFNYSSGTGGLVLMADNASGIIKFATGGNTERWRIHTDGNLSNTVATGTAYLHLKAGTATATTAPLKLTSGTLNTTAEAGAMEFLAENFTLTPTSTARMSVMGVLFTQTADKNISNTVTETTLFGTGVTVGGGLTLPANFFVAGKTLKIHIHGYHSSTGNPNITFKVKLGSVVVCQGTGTSGNGGTDGFYLDSEITCRTTGATGTVSAGAQYDEVHNTGINLGIVQTGTTTIDTTASQVLDVTIEWGTADAGNTITSQIAYVEVLN